MLLPLEIMTHLPSRIKYVTIVEVPASVNALSQERSDSNSVSICMKSIVKFTKSMLFQNIKMRDCAYIHWVFHHLHCRRSTFRAKTLVAEVSRMGPGTCLHAVSILNILITI